MQPKQRLSELTLSELYAKQKKQKQTAIALAIPMVLVGLTLVVLAITTRNYALIAVASGSSVALLPMLTQYKETGKEISNRLSDKNQLL